MDLKLINAIIIFVLIVIFYIILMKVIMNAANEYNKKIKSTKDKRKITLLDIIYCIYGHENTTVEYWIVQDEEGQKFAVNPCRSNVLTKFTSIEPYIVIKKTDPNNKWIPFINKVVKEINFGDKGYLWIDEEKEEFEDNPTYREFLPVEEAKSNMSAYVMGVNKTNTFYNYNAENGIGITKDLKIVTGVIEID